jgi:hypothetical protein
MNIRLRTSARAAFMFGVVVFIFIGVMGFSESNVRPAQYPNQHGYTAAMYWFERTESVRDLFSAIGDPSTDEGIRIRHVMDRVNNIDFGFMVAYSALFASLYFFLGSLLKTMGEKPTHVNLFLSVGLVISLIMLIGDIFENIQLLKLTKDVAEADVDVNTIARLMFFTRLKWFSIFIASIGLSVLYALYARKNWKWHLLGLVYAASGTVGFASFFVPGFDGVLEISANLMGVGWLFSTIHASFVGLKKHILHKGTL